MIYNQAKEVIDAYLKSEKEKVDLSLLNHDLTAVIVVDLVNGFAKEGSLYSDRVEGIIEEAKLVLDQLRDANHVFLCDAHTTTAAEFSVYPSHCIRGSKESELVGELEPMLEKGIRIEKNSTNGFLEESFQDWLKKHDIKHYVIIGCCTDLCVMQFALTLKTHYNRLNREIDIVVLEDVVETYHLQTHPGDFMHIMALKFMQDMGIRIGRIS